MRGNYVVLNGFGPVIEISVVVLRQGVRDVATYGAGRMDVLLADMLKSQ